MLDDSTWIILTTYYIDKSVIIAKFLKLSKLLIYLTHYRRHIILKHTNLHNSKTTWIRYIKILKKKFDCWLKKEVFLWKTEVDIVTGLSLSGTKNFNDSKNGVWVYLKIRNNRNFDIISIIYNYKNSISMHKKSPCISSSTRMIILLFR